MKSIRHLARMLLLALPPLMLAAACGNTDTPPTPPDGTPGVSLVIQVGVNNGVAGTRAAGEYPDGYPYDFEGPATPYENINTLRIIIVRPDNTVEHNRVETFGLTTEPHAVYGDFVFKVSTDQGHLEGGDSIESKRIYLIANEKSLQPSVDFTAYAAGSTLTPATAASWLVYNDWPSGVDAQSARAVPFIDNDAPGSDKKFVPMTEFFDIDIVHDLDAPTGTTVQTERLFITRTLVKFAFAVNVDGDAHTSFRVKNLVFRNLTQKEYLFPNQAEYLPAKYVSMQQPNRIITTYDTPGVADNLIRSYTFQPAALGYQGKGDIERGYSPTYAPQLYFCEAYNNKTGNDFLLDMEVELNDNATETKVIKYTDIRLPNLPAFPRNTIVKINLQFVETEVEGAVDLVPYIGIDLTPGFGFGQLLPGDHDKPEDW